MIEPLKSDWKETGRFGKFKAWMNRISRLLNGLEVTSGGRAELTVNGIKLHLGHRGPFWCSPAGELNMEIAYGELKIGYNLEAIEYVDPDDPLAFTTTHSGSALAVGDYVLGLRVCCNPDTGTSDATWFPEPVLWEAAGGTPFTTDHPTQYTWQTLPTPVLTYVHCEYMILANVSIQYNEAATLVFSKIENVWQNPNMYIPMWHYYQTQDPTSPIDYFEVSWYIPASPEAVAQIAPIGLLS